MPIIRSPSNCRCSFWFPYECGGGSVLSWPRLRKFPPPHSCGNQRLQRQFDGLLMMGIVMPKTCWAVSGGQSNKFCNWLLHLVGCFIWVTVSILWAPTKLMSEVCCLTVPLSQNGCLTEFCIYQAIKRHNLQIVPCCLLHLYGVLNVAIFLLHISIISSHCPIPNLYHSNTNTTHATCTTCSHSCTLAVF